MFDPPKLPLNHPNRGRTCGTRCGRVISNGSTAAAPRPATTSKPLPGRPKQPDGFPKKSLPRWFRSPTDM